MEAQEFEGELALNIQNCEYVQTAEEQESQHDQAELSPVHEDTKGEDEQQQTVEVELLKSQLLSKGESGTQLSPSSKVLSHKKTNSELAKKQLDSRKKLGHYGSEGDVVYQKAVKKQMYFQKSYKEQFQTKMSEIHNEEKDFIQSINNLESMIQSKFAPPKKRDNDSNDDSEIEVMHRGQLFGLDNSSDESNR